MTYKEARELVANASSKEWLNNKASAQFQYPYLNKPLVITGVLPILKHVMENDEAWGNYKNPPEGIKNSQAFYANLKNQLTQFLKNISTQDESWLNNQWHNITYQPIQNGSRNAIEFNSPEGKFLQELFKKQPQAVEGAYKFLINNALNNFNDRQFFTGMLLAYEFKQQEASELGQRRDKSKRSIAAIRNEFEKYFTESEEHLTQFLSEAKRASEENSQAVSDFQKGKEEAYNTWFEKVSSSFEVFDKTSRERASDLEELYQSKLKLEKPAEYWKIRANALKEEGNKWMKLLGVVIGLTALSLFFLLWLVPDGMLANIFKGEASAIKWTIVYVTYLSFVAFGIKTLTKVTYSSFHLARDAEEREQLAYFYLALQKESTIDTTERHLIMQSLFSRSDSGLLKDDSSPTMPGNIVDKVINGK